MVRELRCFTLRFEFCSGALSQEILILDLLLKSLESTIEALSSSEQGMVGEDTLRTRKPAPKPACLSLSYRCLRDILPTFENRLTLLPET